MDMIQILKEKITAQNLWSTEIKLKRNGFLIQAGAIEKYFYLIEEGSLRVYLSEGGEEQVIRFGYQNSIISALDSFFTGEPTRFNIQAIKQTKVRAIEKQSFNKLMRSTDENQKFYLMILEGLVIQQMDREIDILTASPAERYQRVLKRSPHLFQEIPGKYIASYLRMTPETLSRLKKS